MHSLYKNSWFSYPSFSHKISTALDRLRLCANTHQNTKAWLFFFYWKQISFFPYMFFILFYCIIDLWMWILVLDWITLFIHTVATAASMRSSLPRSQKATLFGDVWAVSPHSHPIQSFTPFWQSALWTKRKDRCQNWRENIQICLLCQETVKKVYGQHQCVNCDSLICFC